MSDEPKGLAAIARAAKDPAITVVSLRAAIAEGKLPHEIGVGGRTLVRLSDVKALSNPQPAQPVQPLEAPVAAAPRTPKKSVRLPRRKGRSTV